MFFPFSFLAGCDQWSVVFTVMYFFLQKIIYNSLWFFFLSVHLLFIASPSSFFPSVSLSLHLFRPEPASSSITIGVTSPPTLFLYALLFAFLILHLLLRSFSFIKHFEVSQILFIIICHIHFWKLILDSNLFPVLYPPQKKIFIFFTPDWKQKQGKDTNLCKV